MGGNLALWIFWTSALLLAFTFAGYPLVMALMAWLRRRKPVSAVPPNWPAVDCVLVVHNEAPRIAARLENLLHSHYPQDRLRVIVVCDGCTDNTAQIARQIGGTRVVVLEQRPHQGKAAGLNAGLAAAQGEIVVFADARQMFAPEAVASLVRRVLHPGVGAVSGDYSLHPPADSVGGGVDAYWRWEKFLRQCESRWDSVVGCSGAIYAIRRGLYEPLPPDTLLDDVVIPLRIAARGWRVDFAPEARAWESVPLAAEREFHRKRRTLAGNFQMLCRYPEWLLPWRNRLWWPLLCHKYLRLLAPVGLAALMFANVELARWHPFYALTLGSQLLVYLLALIGLLRPHWHSRILTIPAGFVFLIAAIIAGLWYYLRHRGRGGWQTTSAPHPHVQGA